MPEKKKEEKKKEEKKEEDKKKEEKKEEDKKASKNMKLNIVFSKHIKFQNRALYYKPHSLPSSQVGSSSSGGIIGAKKRRT